MERKLDILLRRFHLAFKQVGPTVEYNGSITPFMATVDRLERLLAAEEPELFSYFKEGMKKNDKPVQLPQSSRTEFT